MNKPADKYAGHTPGPWRPAEQSLSRSIRIVTVASGDRASAGNEIAALPVLSGQPGGTPFDALPEQIKANALLLADAPTLAAENTSLRASRDELLSALKDVLVMWKSPQPTKLDEALSWRQNDINAEAAARAAISRAAATGQPEQPK
jgi:hypothetical protein